MEKRCFEFVGAGRVVRILLQGFKNRGYEPEVRVYDVNEEVSRRLGEDFSNVKVLSSIDEIEGKDIVCLAVHPPAMAEVLEKLSGKLGNNVTVISLAPKFTIKKISSALGVKKVMRMIPTATSFINRGYNPVAFAPDFPEDEKGSLKGIFSLLGQVVEVEERKLEAYAIVSAMLPTYFYFQWETIEELGVKMGLDRDEAKRAVGETLKAAVDMFYDEKLDRELVKDLIPVKPLKDKEEVIRKIYEETLLKLFKKISP
ncbi:pyrroline-5-carboxylate reductase [Desulfurobacterium pacificum]|uniref:Pyrroline-5-carboxylate reductase n=1 Tax=Desulfurobacterium pacificum TaxID=240166 RepID=A0ABY1NA43_9BACT|nr:NAD(P)-binding domain-containing protein [Desulfurobacterium pacificum]SMP04446.1 pyrroline-5-carboxylate reductase [Desulfurobacterium pacificum]